MVEGVGVVIGLRLPDDYPPRSLLGQVPQKLTAEERWENHLLEAKARKAQREERTDDDHP
jgi:hypothetical protein